MAATADPVPWWKKEPLRIVEICDSFSLEGLPLRAQADALKRLGANVQHFHCMLMGGTSDDGAGLNDRRMFFETSVARVKNPDRLAEYLPLAHARGIRVVVYFNVHWYSPGFAREHPDWPQQREDGTAIDDVYETGTSFCVNSPYREWVFQVLHDLCRYDIDGIFYDGPIFFANTCYCVACRSLFQDRAGAELPPKSKKDHPRWNEMVDFQADSLRRFLADSERIIKGINPEILFYMNGNANWPSWPTGRDGRRIVTNTDILGAEGGFLYGDLNGTPVYKPGVSAKLLSCQAEGKPSVVFDCAGHKSWSWYLMPESEIRLILAETLAGGAHYWIALFPTDIGQPALRAITEYNALLKAEPEPFHDTKSLARIALLWPSRACNWYVGSSVPLTDFTRAVAAEGVGDLAEEFNGYYEALARAQVPFDVIDEDSLEDLPRYDLVVLPNAPALSPRAVAGVRSFVNKGGNLVAGFETTLYDEQGARRDDFELADLFGVRFEGGLFGPLRWDYLTRSNAAASPVLKGIGKQFIPAPTYGISVQPTTGIPVLSYCGRLKGSYDHAPEISPAPFLVLNRPGKGRTAFLAGTFGSSLSQFRFPEYLDLVGNIARTFARPLVEIRGAPWVEVSLRGKKDRAFLHLINQTSGVKRPITAIHPLSRVVITVKLGRTKGVTKARALKLGKHLKLTGTTRAVSFTLPVLEDYEVIELS